MNLLTPVLLLLSSSILASGQANFAGPTGCWKGETLAVSMIDTSNSTVPAVQQCFDFCKLYSSEADVRANVYDKSNKRKTRIHCKCLKKDSTETPLTLKCDNLPTQGTTGTNSPQGRPGKPGKGPKWGRRLMKRGGMSKGQLKQCAKCKTVACNWPTQEGCSTTVPVTTK